MSERLGGGQSLVEPVAPRLRRPTWRDPRLVVGVLLVAGSVLLGSWAVRSAGQTISVYTVVTTVTAGQRITADNLVAVDVRLADVDLYFRSENGPPAGGVALRTVGDHELLARSAVGAGDNLDLRLVAVPVTEVLSSSVVAGSIVDLWLVPKTDTRAAIASDASLLAAGLVVAELSERGSGLMSAGAPTVQVLVPLDELPGVLAALAGDGAVDIIPVPGSSS